MPSCKGCGADIDSSDRECPYCGESVLQISQQSTIENPGSTYEARIDAEGHAHIRFGDGQIGKRPSSGGSTSGHYRYGGGTQGNVPSGSLEEKLDQVDRQLAKVPDSSKHKGSKDVGVALLESMSAMGDILSMYQSSTAHEAHLSTGDRDRLSRKEERIRPKLEAVVAFCEKADSKTIKRMGLSVSDIHKIRTTATRTLQMTESRTGKCSKCGSMNRPGAKQCQNCGAHF